MEKFKENHLRTITNDIVDTLRVVGSILMDVKIARFSLVTT